MFFSGNTRAAEELHCSWLAPLLIVLTARKDWLSGVSAVMLQTWKDGILHRAILGMEYGV